MNTYGLSSTGYSIYLTRYALKDIERAFQPGDLAIWHGKGIGTVAAVDGDFINLDLDGLKHRVEKKFLERPVEVNPQQSMKRVATALASTVEEHIAFETLLADNKFWPAGRTMAGAGTNSKLSLMNCFVLPSPADSREGILDTLRDMMNIMATGGGVGINLSSLRPRNAIVRGVNGHSSGPVAFAELYSTGTNVIQQGGKRRGALMLILDIWHPDILEFINSKRDNSRLNGCNISVGLTADFMEAVEQDAEWELVFPETNSQAYHELWDGDLDKWKRIDHHGVHIYQRTSARALWEAIVGSAWVSAEPGLWFRDRSNAESNSFYYNTLVCTNPCGEQPLSGYGACNLGSINLRQYVVGQQVDLGALSRDTATAVRLLDNVLDAQAEINIEASWYPKALKNILGERRIGLGVMGLADVMALCGVTYGNNQECHDFIDMVYDEVSRAAYRASAGLAKEKGVFPFYKKRMAESGFLQRHPELAVFAKRGLRNVTLLSQAPNGTIGTVNNVSTGVEPYFAPYWERKTNSGQVYKEFAKACEAYVGKKLPTHFRFAMRLTSEMRRTFGGMSEAEAEQYVLTPEDHVAVQAWIQYWVDSAISKTCNVPENYNVDQVSNLYWFMYRNGIKGGTIYRDHSRSEQVLSTVEPTCPECGHELVNEAGCSSCKECGYSMCRL